MFPDKYYLCTESKASTVAISIHRKNIRQEYNLRYRTPAGLRFDRTLFVRLVEFGLPNSIQFFLDMIGVGLAVSAFLGQELQQPIAYSVN